MTAPKLRPRKLLKGVRLKLALLPGLRWKGFLTILAPAEAPGPHGVHVPGYSVAFDAEVVAMPGLKYVEQARYVYDRTVLTAEQVHAWTGWKE